MNTLLLIQKTALRIIFNVNDTSHTHRLFEITRIPRIYSLYFYKLGMSLKKLNPNFYMLFNLEHSALNYNLRNYVFYDVPVTRLRITDTSLDVVVPKLLNHFHSNNIIIYQISWKDLKLLLYNFCL